jgi:prepilin-type N-terminal cleavage/methylation domain-containing protein
MTPPYIRPAMKTVGRKKGGLRTPVKKSRGFSILELLIVVSVIAVLGIIAIPNMMTVISNARLLGGGTNLSGLLQNCRMLAVKQNTTMTAHFTVLGNGPVAFAKQADAGNTLATTDPQIQLGAPLVMVTPPSGPGAPAALTTSELGFTAVSTDPSFNSRGLPCAYSGGNCPSAGFVYYFRDNRPLGQSGWIAVSVSPAGRIRRWVYSGTVWGS